MPSEARRPRLESLSLFISNVDEDGDNLFKARRLCVEWKFKLIGVRNWQLLWVFLGVTGHVITLGLATCVSFCNIPRRVQLEC